ncbi:hypothetical protein P879_09614 [Paragonimus westermani]|uniref:Uncharacterized protein n=1 Tax=Paragonimus westermani TaxID=34504 RepID=A0A8T0DHP0_9TREM|nr:hypothetical protein P879_09614 [Paragonimus westermani]
MDNDNGYDVPTEEIQKEIMENLQTWSVANSDDVNFEISQEDEIILKPYVRPCPAELFRLTEDDKAEFENLRSRLGLHSDESRGCVSDTISETERPMVNLTAPKLLRHEKLDRPVQSKAIQNHSSNTSRNRVYSQYYPSAMISIDQDKQWTELNNFLDNYHVSQDKLDTVFDFDGTAKICDSNENEHIVLEYLRRMSEKFRENQPKSCRLGDGTEATHLEIVKTMERKTVCCDLRTQLTKRNPSKLLTKQVDVVAQSDSESFSDSGADQDQGLWLEQFRAHRQLPDRNSENSRIKTNKVMVKAPSISTQENNLTPGRRDCDSCEKLGGKLKDVWNDSVVEDRLEELRTSETFLARRRRFCEEFVRSVGIQRASNLLLHEDSSFSAGIPLLDDFFSERTTDSTVHLVCESPWTSWEQSGFDSGHCGLLSQAINSARQSWFVFFAFVSWLLSLVTKEEQKATVSSSAQVFCFNTVGFVQIATRQNESQPPSVNRPQIHALLQIPSSGTIMCEQIKHKITDEFKNQLSSWKPDEALIWNVDHVALPSFDGEPDLSTLTITRPNVEDWKQQFPNRMPSIYAGEFGNSEQTRAMIWDSEQHRIPNKTNRLNGKNNFGSRWDDLLDSDSATAVIEMPLTKFQMSDIQKTLFALLVNLHLKALDLVGIRLGWISTWTGNRMTADSTLSSHSRIPCVALAVRGYKAWQYSKNVCDWMTSKIGSDDEMLRCYGSRYQDFNLKHLVRWFGPRLPDVTGLSPLKIVRIKHQASKLLTHSKNCWLVRSMRNDLVILLDKSLSSCLTGILKAVVNKCGYQVIWLSRFTCVTPPDLCALRMLVVSESKLPVEAKCNSLNSVLEPSSPEMLIVLRRENANAHAIHLCEQVKMVVQRSLDSTQERRSSEYTAAHGIHVLRLLTCPTAHPHTFEIIC